MAAVDRINGLTGNIAVKVPCEAATTANITLAAEQTIDGVAVTAGDRVLVKNQTTASENGIYIVSTGNWSRSTDFNGNGDAVNGTFVLVLAGATQYLKIYRLVYTGTLTIGTTSISFSEVTNSFNGTSTDNVSALKNINTADTTLAFVTGYYTSGDRPPRLFRFNSGSSATDNGGTIIAPNSGTGRWEMMHGGVLHVADFGAGSAIAGGSNVTAMQAAIAANPSVLLMDPVTYNLWPTGTITGSEVLFDMASKKGIRIDGRGATLNIEDILVSPEQPTVFKMDGCTEMEVENLKVTNGTAMSTAYGVTFAHLTNATKRVSFQNISVSNALTGVECVRNPLTEGAATKVDGVSLINCFFNDVAYPINFQNSGDNIFARNIVIDGCARAYFPYGTFGNHDIELSVKNATTSPTCNITAHSTDETTNQTSNIRLKVVSLGNDDGSQPNLVGLNWGFVEGSGLACTMRNIDVEILADYDDTSAQYAMFSCQKTITGVGADNTPSRGHIGENIDVKVSMRESTNAGNKIVMFSSTQGDWTGETIRGVTIQAQLDQSGDILVNGEPFQDALVLKNSRIPNTSSDSLLNFTYGVKLENTEIEGNYYDDTYWPQTLSAAGAASVVGITYLDGSSAGFQATLANGPRVGAKKVFSLIDATNPVTLDVATHKTSSPENFTFSTLYGMIEFTWVGDKWITSEQDNAAPT